MTKVIFDGDGFDDEVADGDVQAMARRQFSVSLVVGFALLAVVAFLFVQAPRISTGEMTAHHRVVQPTPANVDTAQPSVAAKTHG